MTETNVILTWLMTSLFLLGVLLVPLGLSFLFIPERVSRIGNQLNRWINTERFFDVLNRPRFQERLIYRYHRIFGIMVMICTAICIYMTLFYANTTLVLNNILLLVDTVFAQTVVTSLYYLLIGFNALAFIIGLILAIRPSILKHIERLSNRWFEAEKNLKVLDNTRDLPATIFPGNPRIFGTLILIGAIYIIVSTRHILM